MEGVDAALALGWSRMTLKGMDWLDAWGSIYTVESLRGLRSIFMEGGKGGGSGEGRKWKRKVERERREKRE